LLPDINNTERPDWDREGRRFDLCQLLPPQNCHSVRSATL